MPPRLSSIPCSSSLHFRNQPPCPPCPPSPRPAPPTPSRRMRNRPRQRGSGSLSAPPTHRSAGHLLITMCGPIAECAGGHLWFAAIETQVLWGWSGSQRAAALPAFTATLTRFRLGASLRKTSVDSGGGKRSLEGFSSVSRSALLPLCC